MGDVEELAKADAYAIVNVTMQIPAAGVRDFAGRFAIGDGYLVTAVTLLAAETTSA